MSVLYLLIIISILVALGFLAAFIWAVKSGQFEDDYSPSVRILFDQQNSEDEDTPEKDETVEENPEVQQKINT
jgi:cbb3-type cytochrome oxidase maturation protein